MKNIAYGLIDYHQITLTITILIQNRKKIHETVRLRNCE